ncbi:MAG: ATP-binding protein [Desulfocapsaceae bacterium]|nr:ATP-binding protein [Desulfocapsaceae bacterium]
MRVEKLIISNFRSYKDEITIELNDLNVFVGPNDIGKSTILEALDIFLNEGKSPGIIKIDKEDVNKQAQEEGNTEIKIGVVFSNLPEALTIDATNPTTLESEYLLNREGKLEIIKKYPNGGKEKVFVKAYHPTNPECSDLHLKKQTELRRLLTDEMECEDQTRNAAIRKAIWRFYEVDLRLDDVEIELAKIDAKNTWDLLKAHLPVYALFQSDRKNSDGDSEVQNPLKLAVQEILKDQRLSQLLNEVASEVETKLQEVAANTLEKLNEMNPEVANTLNPVIPSPDSLKWVDVFKSVSITGDEDIPINKRGSGVKRLILLNFFRAEAERRKNEQNSTDIIYAIEEPETSQHPRHQRKLIKAFRQLSEAEHTQVLMTTHSPAVVKLLEFNHIKLVTSGDARAVVNVEQNELPYPSLNEVNFLAFGEADQEYHNELYGFIESEGLLNDFKTGKPTIPYTKILRDDTTREVQIIISEYIRHQIHHPENPHNERYTDVQLQNSITEMRTFIEGQ